MSGTALADDITNNEFGIGQDSNNEPKMKSYIMKAGDIGIGFDASPVLDLALNAIKIQTDTGARASDLHNWTNGFTNTIVGKYYLNSNMAIRSKLAFNIRSNSSVSYYDNPIDLADTEVSADDVEEISDNSTSSTTGILLSGGVEWRRGQKRLQGFYGAEGILGYGGTTSNTEYGWNYTSKAQELNVIADGTERVTATTSGAFVSIGLRGFAGVEWFATPQISISAEYGYVMGYTSQGRGGDTLEVWNIDDDGNGSSSTDTNAAGGSGSSIGMGVDNGMDVNLGGGTGALMLTFHI